MPDPKPAAAKTVVVHTDGACSGNPGPGGFAAILRHGNHEGTRSGAHPDTTNNQMELMAVISALEALSEPCRVDIHTDSNYVRDGITKWIDKWKRNGWRTSDKKAVKNEELWRRLDTARSRHNVEWHWVKGHAGDPLNERADELARDALDALRAKKLLPVDMSETPADPKANIRVTSGKAGSAPPAKPVAKSRKKSQTGPPAAASTHDGPQLVLASSSPYRRELLERLGYPFTAEAPGVDEAAVKAQGLVPERTVMEIALQKAGVVSKRRKQTIVIASDQGPEFDGELLDKPGTAEKAVAQLTKLSGKTHRLLTALVVHDGRTGKTIQHLDVHEVTLRKLTREQIEAYVGRDEPEDCAGSYRWESLGVALFDSVRGDDSTAIIGLPMIKLVAMLAELGVDVLTQPSTWPA